VVKKENKKIQFQNIEIADLRNKELSFLQMQDDEVDLVQKISNAKQKVIRDREAAKKDKEAAFAKIQAK
jgi:hypothetical protein